MDVLTYQSVIEEGYDFLTQFLTLTFSVRRTLEIDSSARNGPFPWLLRVPHKPLRWNTLLETLYLNTVRFCRSLLWDGLRSKIRYKFLSVHWSSFLFVGTSPSFLPKLYIYKPSITLFLSGSIGFLDVSTTAIDFASNVSIYCPEGDINTAIPRLASNPANECFG